MYPMNKFMMLSGVALLGLTGPAVAQAPAQAPNRAVDVTRAAVIQRTDAAFARLDANQDGRFTREEAQAMGRQRREQRMTQVFDRIDADNDGRISREEFAQRSQNRRGPGMRGSRGPGGPGPVADGGPDGPPPPGGPGMRRGGHGGPGMRMRTGARLFGDAGFITAEQFRNVALARFDRADADHDGTLTAAERQAQHGQMRGRMRHRMGPPPGGPGAPPPPNPAG
jgi:hypothetical protein